jgi:hypothetical protein
MKHFFSSRKLFWLVTAVCVSALFANCDMPAGLGTEIDLQNPEISIRTITTPDGAVVWESGVTTIKLPQKSSVFILEGEWTDNVEVRKLQVGDDSTGQVYGSGSISKSVSNGLGAAGTWRSQIDLQDRSGDVPLRVTAYDFSGNSGMAQVTILVDLTPPMVLGTDLIRHSGLMPYTTLKSESFLANVSRENVADIDNLQNEFFVIQATMDEKILSDAGVDEARLNIHTFNDALGSEKTILSDLKPFTVPESLPDEDFSLLGKNLKKPWWCVDHAMLAALGIGLETGAHKLRLSITARDDAENVGVTELEWLIWENESDKPRARALNGADGRIVLQDGDKLELTVFDDDNLGQVYAKVFKDKDARNALFTGGHDPDAEPDLWLTDMVNNINTVITNMDAAIDADIAAEDPGMDAGAAHPWARETFSGSLRTRQKTYRLDPGGEGDIHYLVVLVKDKKDDNDRIFEDAWSAIMYSVSVSDKDEPIIIIETPHENTVPAVPDNKIPIIGEPGEFTIKGFTLDNVGTVAARIAWIPVALRGAKTEADLIEEAKEALGRTSITDGAVVEGGHGIKVWNFPFNGISDTYVGYARHFVEKTFDIRTDFTYNDGSGDKTENEAKLFVLYTSDGANKVYSTFRMAKYIKIPLIDASQSVLNGENENTASVIVTFSARSAAAGILMDELSYRVTVEEESSPLSLESLGGGSYSATISGNMGELKTFIISVRDKLGLLAEERRQIRLTRLPKLLYVSSTLAGATPDGKRPYGPGQIISVQAHFDLAVAVLDLDGSDSTNPYINLGNFTDNIPRTAAYKTGSGGTTLTFEYTVAANDSTEYEDSSLFQGITTGLTPINVPAGARIIAASDVAEADWVGDAIITLGSKAETLEGSKTLVVDGIKPVLKTIKFDDPENPGPGTDYFKEGDTVRITAIASEPLFVSASPDLHIRIRDGAGLNAASFSQVNQDTMEFSYLVQDNAANGRLDFKPGAFISETHAADIKDEAGNTLDCTVNPELLEEAYIDTVVNDPVIRLSSGSELPEGESYYNTSQTITISGASDAVTISYYVQKGQEGAGWLEKRGPAHPQGPETISILLAHTGYDAGNAGGYSISQYRISAYQTDRAGNSSSPLATRTVSINDKFPDIDEISIEQANGIYSVGQTLTFKAALSDKVVLTPKSTGVFTIRSKNLSPGEGEVEALIPAGALRKPASGTSETDLLHFDWVIPEDILWLDGIEVKPGTIDFSGLRDMYNNAGPKAASDNSLDRDGIIIDSIPPKIDGFSPAQTGNGKTGGAVLAPGDKLILTFNENVWPESGGEIIIRPYPISKWYLPAVLSEAEFNSVYRSALIDAEDQRTLYTVDGRGVPLERDGTAFGPNQEYSNPSNTAGLFPRTNFYSLTTHGLKAEGTNQIPDLTSKYVLNYQFANYDQSDYDAAWGGANQGNGTTDSIAYLRAVFNKAEYDWYRVDVNAQGIVTYEGTTGDFTRNKASITLPAELPAGRQWEVMIKPGSFRDRAGNLQAKVGWEGDTGVEASHVWHFWSRGAATPTIRVNRVSYNGENPQPSAVAATQTAPPNDTPVRIDSQTPGAVLNYGILNEDSEAPTYNAANGYFNGTADIAKDAGKNDDAAATDLSGITIGTGYTAPFYAGSGTANGTNNVNRYTARKDYVAATAAPGWTMPGWDTGTMQQRAYEGVFRTVVMLKAPTGGGNILGWKISGSDKGWINGIAGFPFYEVENTSEYYGAQTYRVNYTNDNSIDSGTVFGFLWVSWEIVSDWEYRGMGRHWTNTTTPQTTGDRMVENNASATATDHTFATYGSLIYDVGRQFYGNGS